MSKNLAAKERCIFGSTERFGCMMIAEFTNERKVRCHTGLWKSLVSEQVQDASRQYLALDKCTNSKYSLG